MSSLFPKVTLQIFVSECLGSEEKWTKARQMLNELKESQMKKALPKDKILTYHVNWNENGGTNFFS